MIRFFYKAGLDKRTGHVVEAGAGNGNNLALFAEYGWKVTGIDLLEEATADAAANFAHHSDAKFLTHDLDEGLPPGLDTPIDCLSLANVINYLPRENYERLLAQFADMLSPGAWIFLRTRTPQDYRFGRGEQVAPDAFILDTTETGENGLLNVFYEETQMAADFIDVLGVDPDSIVTLYVDHQNLQQGQVISNSDLIMWAECSR